jgi:hypothetical protein
MKPNNPDFRTPESASSFPVELRFRGFGFDEKGLLGFRV